MSRQEKLFEQFELDLFELIPNPDYKVFAILLPFYMIGRDARFNPKDCVFAHKNFMDHINTKKYNVFSLEDYRRKFRGDEKIKCKVFLRNFAPKRVAQKDFKDIENYVLLEVRKAVKYRDYQFESGELIYTNDQYYGLMKHCNRTNLYSLTASQKELPITLMEEIDYQEAEKESNRIKEEEKKMNRNVKRNAIRLQMETNKNINKLVEIMAKQAEEKKGINKLIELVSELIETMKAKKGKK